MTPSATYRGPCFLAGDWARAFPHLSPSPSPFGEDNHPNIPFLAAAAGSRAMGPFSPRLPSGTLEAQCSRAVCGKFRVEKWNSQAEEPA